MTLGFAVLSERLPAALLAKVTSAFLVLGLGAGILVARSGPLSLSQTLVILGCLLLGAMVLAAMLAAATLLLQFCLSLALALCELGSQLLADGCSAALVAGMISDSVL